jgi:hypothetical protein
MTILAESKACHEKYCDEWLALIATYSIQKYTGLKKRTEISQHYFFVRNSSVHKMYGKIGSNIKESWLRQLQLQTTVMKRFQARPIPIQQYKCSSSICTVLPTPALQWTICGVAGWLDRSRIRFLIVTNDLDGQGGYGERRVTSNRPMEKL